MNLQDVNILKKGQANASFFHFFPWVSSLGLEAKRPVIGDDSDDCQYLPYTRSTFSRKRGHHGISTPLRHKGQFIAYVVYVYS